MNKKKKFSLDRVTFLLFTIIPLILYTFFYIISVVSGMYYSLTDWNGLNPTYNFVGISNYIALSKNIFMWRSLGRTLLYALLLVVSITLLSLIIALVLNSVNRFKVFTKSVFFFPAMLGSVAVALIWDQMFYQLIPAIGRLLGLNLQTPLASSKTAI
ncbi:MAG: carbohydrate ABC transporter permease [Eisenbergiella massiliensis]